MAKLGVQHRLWKIRPAQARAARLVLGAFVWVWAVRMVMASVVTIRDRLARPVELLYLELPPKSKLRVGDPVYLGTDQGLRRAGEVSKVRWTRAELAIQSAALEALNHSVEARFWRTPLSAEAVVNALLPPGIRTSAARRIIEDWKAQEQDLAQVWQPLVTDWAISYLDVLFVELSKAWNAHESELVAAAQVHAKALGEQWPEIQRLLRPILQEHLTPVLGRMITDALSEVPKVEIAMLVARGKHGEAYERMLDWLVGYLAAIPNEDRDRLNQAVRLTWEAASNNPELVLKVRSLYRPILEDEELHRALMAIYRDAVADNPQTTAFVRSKVLDDTEVQAQAFAFLDAFAPTVRTVSTLCLFDEHGATRAEVVHLIRSIALQRQVAWVTLQNRMPSGLPLSPKSSITAEPGELSP